MLIRDQLGRNIEVVDCPQRIVSLVPSQTEFLVDIGLEDQIVGITNFCVHPPHLRKQKERIGGTKDLSIEKIKALNPDFILGNKEENRKEDLLQLAEEYPVWISDIVNYDQSISMMRSIGELCNKQQKTEKLIKEINEGFRKLPIFDEKRPSAVYLIWKEPLMSVSGNTFIGFMMRKLGLTNPLEFESGRYPELTEKQIKSIKPDFILLSSEPYPFKKKQLKEFQERFPDSKVLLVDGEMFSWYGSRMVYSAEYFLNLFPSETS